MGVIKTTIVVDERVGKECDRSVSSIYGSLRMTRFAVEETKKCFNAVELLKSFSKLIGLLPAHTGWSGGPRRDP